jgi:hypothetical protein
VLEAAFVIQLNDKGGFFLAVGCQSGMKNTENPLSPYLASLSQADKLLITRFCLGF